MSLIGSKEQGNGLSWKLQDETYKNNQGMYTQYRVCSGIDGSGDIYQWRNVEQLQRIILNDTVDSHLPENLQSSGMVHLVVADGGFDNQRDAENQEEVAQSLIVCEVAASLSLLQKGGTLVLKAFGSQTAVIRTVMQHLFFSFDSFVIIKPIASRPASAERYVVCTGFHGNPSGWNGKRWCNQMLLGRCCPLSNYPHLASYDRDQSFLSGYLDQFDRDLLNLNLKACFSILSYMESKCQQIRNGGDHSMEVDEDYGKEAPRINIASYKYTWRLV